jgi:hypothetical protein
MCDLRHEVSSKAHAGGKPRGSNPKSIARRASTPRRTAVHMPPYPHAVPLVFFACVTPCVTPSGTAKVQIPHGNATTPPVGYNYLYYVYNKLHLHAVIALFVQKALYATGVIHCVTRPCTKHAFFAWICTWYYKCHLPVGV